MKLVTKSLRVLFALALSLGLAGNAVAAEGKIHHIVIQVSSADPGVQKLAINNVANLQQHYGADNVDIELVAYGPGLSLLTVNSPEAPRIETLAVQDIRFSACGNTIKAVTKKTGKAPVLTDGVQVTPAGVARIVELQEQGYAYVKP